MNPQYIKVIYSSETLIHARHESTRTFDNPWHFHPEMEINLILKGTGTRFVGDSTDRFQPYDLVFLGPNIPHYWHSDHSAVMSDREKSEALIIRFREHFMGTDFYNLPETNALKTFYEQGKRGIKFNNYDVRIVEVLKMLVKQDGLRKMSLFLELLDLLMQQPNYEYLSSEGFMTSLNPRQEKRMNDIYHFITQNFREKIPLKDIAERAYMNPSALSRYFKFHTGKSITEFLQDLRIGYACKLLIHSDSPISEIIHESGFNNQSHFNNVFLNKMKTSPKFYRSGYKKGIQEASADNAV